MTVQTLTKPDIKTIYKKGEDYIGVAVVFFCHDGKGSFVMDKRGENARDENGKWEFGGGGLKFGETPEDALRRELKDEYCADIIEYEFLGFRNVRREREGKLTHWITLDYKVLVDRDQVKNGEPHVLDAVEWFTLDTMPENTISTLTDFWKQHKEKLITF